jgi:hypothetical protein
MDIHDILADRGKKYGVFSEQAKTAQALKQILFKQRPRHEMSADQAEAMDMMCTKLSRLVHGDHNHVDGWVDIAGFSQLVVDRLLEQSPNEKPSPRIPHPAPWECMVDIPIKAYASHATSPSEAIEKEGTR